MKTVLVSLPRPKAQIKPKSKTTLPSEVEISKTEIKKRCKNQFNVSIKQMFSIKQMHRDRNVLGVRKGLDQ